MSNHSNEDSPYLNYNELIKPDNTSSWLKSLYIISTIIYFEAILYAFGFTYTIPIILYAIYKSFPDINLPHIDVIYQIYLLLLSMYWSVYLDSLNKTILVSATYIIHMLLLYAYTIYDVVMSLRYD